MNQTAEEYIGNLVRECLQSPGLAGLPDGEKSDWIAKIRNHLYQVVLTTEIGKLSDEQVAQLENLDPESPEMEAKLKEFSQTIPTLGEELKSALNQAAEFIKQRGELPGS